VQNEGIDRQEPLPCRATGILSGMSGTAPSRARVGFAVAALAALIIAAVFLTIGDGVDASAEGWRGPVLEFGHALVWLLLAAALGVAAIEQRWSRASAGLCGVAGVGYLTFLAALFTA
jgi:hypothetical protein